MLDWTKIEQRVRAGEAYRAIARDNPVSHVAIRKRAIKHGWVETGDPVTSEGNSTSVTETETKRTHIDPDNDPLEGLNIRQARFAANYAMTGHAEKSAKAAGYSDTVAKKDIGSLTKNPKVRKAVSELSRRHIETMLDRTWLIDQLITNHELAVEGNPVLDRYGNPTGTVMRQINASNGSLKLIGELAGYLGKDANNITVNINTMSESDVDANMRAIEAELAKLGASQPIPLPESNGDEKNK
jgi:hypothetical protein